MNKYIIIGVVLVIGISVVSFLLRSGESLNKEFTEVENNLSVISETKTEDINNLDDKKIMNAILHTNKGNITIQFFNEQAPNTVANFIKLAGENFYNGVKFHRVIKGFMIQGGDPLTKDDSKMALWGTGGPGYSFAD